jgi:hypothetical protein
MNEQELHASLEALRQEIARLEVKDGRAKQRVERLVVDLEHQLEHPDDHAHRLAVLAQVPGLVEQFEMDHPRLIEILNRAVEALSGAGI